MDIKSVNRVKGGNRFCGPAAISAVVGCTTDEAARVLREVSGKRAILGTHPRDVRSAFSHFGVKMEITHNYPDKKSRPTLASWLRETSSMRSAGRVFILAAGNHWQVISGRRYVCGKVDEVVPLSHESVKKRARVKYVYELRAPNGIVKKPLAAQPPVTAAQMAKRIDAASRRRAKELAEKHDIEIEDLSKENGTIWVYPPSGIFCEDENDGRPEDPHADEHWCDSWDEALRRVESYAKWLSENVIPAEEE